MLDNIILHNPRCSKSRQTLALLNQNGVSIKIIEYLKEPLKSSEIDAICKLLNLEPQKIIRNKEKAFVEQGFNISDDKTRRQWIDILSKNPIFIERPIVVLKGRAAICRPPEKVLDII